MGSRFSIPCLGQQESYCELTVKSNFHTVNDTDTFLKYLTFVKQNKQLPLMLKKLLALGYVDAKSENLTTRREPFNIFARLAIKAQPNFVNQMSIMYRTEFMVCHNLADNDNGWSDPDCKTAAMAGPDINGPGHVFITIRNLNWKYFNIASLAFETDALIVLTKLKRAAKRYATLRRWRNPGFYFHCYPHSSVNSLHLHVVNLDTAGWNLKANSHKNLSIDDAMEVIMHMHSVHNL
jgi:hypothetical protein